MKRLIKLSLVLAFATIVLSGCSCYNKMLKKIDSVETSCSPAVLSLKGDQVTADVTVTFPEKYFNKEALLKVTPVLVYEGGEIVGTPKYVQGESVEDNYTIIPYKTGGSYTQQVVFPYDENARLSTLELRIEGKCEATCTEKYQDFTPFTAIPVAQGISTVQNDADLTAYTQLLADNYKRVYTVSKDAEILYLINRSNVRSAELTTEQIDMFKEFVAENNANERATMGNIYSKGYASPDGTVQFNDKLAKERSESGNEAITSALADESLKYDVAAYGEDWEGFKKLVEESDIEDKALILQVLQMYDNPVKRDEEIKNMTAVFEVLATEVLPKLRRTQFVANADIQNWTDAELKAMVSKGCEGMDVEAALFAATLYDDCKTKCQIYKYAAEKFNCYRAYNNLGVTLIKCGKVAEAKTALNKAASLNSAPEISNNLAVVAIVEGDLATAKSCLASLNSAEANANKGLIALQEGEYADASKTLTGYNLAVAEVCDGDLAAAKSALVGCDSADASYLKAVIASREGDTQGAIANLKSAVAADSSLAEKAKTDVEFASLFGTTEFLSL